MIRIISFLIAVFFFSQPFFGQTAWTRSTPLFQENDIFDMTDIPGTSKIVAVGAGSTIMFSSNMVETWQLSYNPAGLPNNTVLRKVYFYDSSLGFISGYHYDQSTSNFIFYILKTTNGGASWIEITDRFGSGNVKTNDFYFLNSETGFMLTTGTLHKTTDGGESWDILELGDNNDMNSIDFVNDSTGFIVMSSTNEMLKTTNYGNDWSLVNFVSPVSDLGLQKIQFINNTTGFVIHTYGQILKTTDSGLSWQAVYESNSINVHTFHFFDENHGVAVGWKVQLMTSLISTTDGGMNWHEFILPEFTELTNSVCCLNSSTFVYGGMYGMVFKSTNAGNNWMPMYERELWGDIYQVQDLGDNTILCLSTSRLNLPYQSSILYKSENGGESFLPIKDFLVMDQDIKTPAAFYFINHENGFLTYYSNANVLIIMKTVDGGESWNEIELETYSGKPYAIYFYDQQNGLISGEGGFILKTVDSGETWTEVYNTPYSFYLMDIHYFNENDIIICGASYWNSVLSKLIISNDGGNTWTDMILGMYGIIYDIEVINNSIFLACENNAILKSPDLGNTWQYSQINNAYDIKFHSLHFPSEDIGYAAGNGLYETMMKTTDGGNTWNVLTTGISSSLNAVHFVDEMNGRVYGQNGVVLETNSGGVVSIPEDQNQKTDKLLSIYPNPFNENFTIKYQHPQKNQSLRFKLYSSTGKLIIDYCIPKWQNEKTIQANKLQAGIYLIQWENENKVLETRKLIKLQ